jgi:hypothetical protein
VLLGASQAARCRVNTSQRYEVRVRGHLAPEWAAWLDNPAIENCANGEAVLTASVADQAALNGLLNRVFALNLKLLAVTLLPAGQP